jgi:gas vesicle protein
MIEDRALLARLDLAIDKLSDVSADIKAVLAVHETKFDNQENLNNTYYDQIEKLHARIGELRDDCDRQCEEVKSVITQKMSGHSERITSLEKWRWIVVGAIILGAFLLSTNLVDLLN